MIGSAATAGTRDVTALLDVSCNAILTETGTVASGEFLGKKVVETFTAAGLALPTAPPRPSSRASTTPPSSPSCRCRRPGNRRAGALFG